MKELSKRENEILHSINKILVDSLHPDRITLFGSKTKDSGKSTSSDFDIAIDAGLPSLQERIKIEEEIDKVSGLYSVDIVYMNETDDEFRNIVRETGEVIYGG